MMFKGNLLSFHPGNSGLPQTKTKVFYVYKVFECVKNFYNGFTVSARFLASRR